MSNKRGIFVDPGVHEVSFSVFQGREFITAELFRGLNYEKRRHIASFNPDYIVVEKPKVYIGAANRKNADPADLIDLACTAGACMAACPVAYSVKPSHWKGEVPKAVHHHRYAPRMTAAMCRAVEAVPKTLQHNVLDAICLGLWWHETHPLGALGYETE